MKILLPLKFDIKLFLLLAIAFIVSTIVGTVSHEFGHFTVAKYLGYSSNVSYGYTIWDDNKTRPFIDSTYSKYSKEINSNIDYPRKSEFDQIQKKLMRDDFWITLGGPIQTMLTGTLGLLLLLNQRAKIYKTQRVNLYQWFVVFVTLFWLRQLANFLVGLLIKILHGKFPERGDEFEIADFLKLPTESISLLTAIIALGITLLIIFKIIPLGKRLTFIASGLIGGVIGYNFWLVWVGPIIMP